MTEKLKPEPGQIIELFPRKFGKSAFLLDARSEKPETITIPLSEWFSRIRAKEMEGYIVFEIHPRPAVIVAAVTGEDKIVLVRQYRHAADQEIIEVPGGLPEGDERPEETARRELKEETGYAPGSITRLTEKPVWFEPASVRTPFWPCLARDCRRLENWQPDQSEPNEVLTIPLTEWVQHIQRGEVLDAKSIVTTYLALPRLKG